MRGALRPLQRPMKRELRRKRRQSARFPAQRRHESPVKRAQQCKKVSPPQVGQSLDVNRRGKIGLSRIAFHDLLRSLQRSEKIQSTGSSKTHRRKYLLWKATHLCKQMAVVVG